MPGDRCDRGTLDAVYGAGSELYAELWSPVIVPPAVSLVARMELAHAHWILDVGSGTGALTSVLRRAAHTAQIVSLELSGDMLRLAKDGRNVHAIRGDAMALPVGDGLAQAVVLAFVLFHLTDPERGLQEARRVLCSGGQVGTVTWAREWPSHAAKVWDEVLEQSGVPTLPAHGNHSGLDSVEAIRELVGRSGLSPGDIWVETIEHTFVPEDFFRLRSGYGLHRARLNALDEAARRRILAEVRRRFEQLAPSDHCFRGEVVCSVSTRE